MIPCLTLTLSRPCFCVALLLVGVQDLVKYFKVHDSVGLPCRLSHACAYYDNIMPKPVDATLFGFGGTLCTTCVQAGEAYGTCGSDKSKKCDK